MALLFIVLLSPLLAVLSCLILIDDGWPFWFYQQRTGKQGKNFWMVKFRSMKVGAEKEQKKYQDKNEADGPVFKIYNDPRLTRMGKILFHVGLDELPQLFNIVRGEMSFVGPRPLPMEERNKLPKKYLKREEVLPGIISPWVFAGYHKLSFKEWMESDLKYIEQKNIFYDSKLFFDGGVMILRLVVKELIDILTHFDKSV